MVNESATNKIQMWLAASGMFCIVLYVIGWGIIGMCAPPWIPAASMSAQEFYDFYRDNGTRIMVGQTIATFAAGIFMAFSCQVAAQMWQRGKSGQVLALMQLVGGVLTGVAGMVGGMLWLALAEFSTQMDPAMVKFFHFSAWYLFDGTYFVTVLQFAGIGLMGLLDDSETPLFPRWTAVFTTVFGVSYVTLALLPFDHTGAFSYDGLVNWYWVWFTFFLDCVWVSICCIRDLRRRQAGTEPQARAATARPARAATESLA
jgi:hypothetical protein